MHSLIPCRQCNIVHCNFCPSTAHLCLWCGVSSDNTRVYTICSFRHALVQWMRATQLSAWCARWIWCGSLARAFHFCGILCTLCISLTTETPSAGAMGCPEALLKTMLQPGLYKDARQVVESHWNNCHRRQNRICTKKNQTTNKKQQSNPELYFVLFLLSSHCYFLFNHRHPLLLYEVSAFSSLSSLVNHSMCLPIMMPIFITPIWEKEHAWKKEKSKGSRDRTINTFS